MTANVWEETWAAVSAKATGSGVELHVGPDQVGCVPFGPSWDEDDGDFARARLAAAAPEMARLLLELQAVDTSDGEYRERCPVCQDKTYGPQPPGMVGIPVDTHPGKHAPDCRLVAVLRKAGVLP